MMKYRKLLALLLLVLLLFPLACGCDVLDAMKITPAPTSTPTQASTPAPTPTTTPLSTPTPALIPSPSSDPSTAIVFKVPIVEKIIRILLNKANDPITAGDMLRVYDFTTSVPGCESLGGTIKTLDDLRWCPNLRSVLLLYQEDINNIAALSGTRELIEFQCVTILDDYAPLFANKKLQKIYLRGATDGAFRKLIANCSQLRDINLISSEISPESIRMLAENLTLSRLALNDCGITDVSPYAGFENLSYLNLGFNQIKDLSPLAENHTLSFNMLLYSNEISDWSPLEGMSSLMCLYVGNNPVTESPALDKLEENGCKVYR